MRQEPFSGFFAKYAIPRFGIVTLDDTPRNQILFSGVFPPHSTRSRLHMIVQGPGVRASRSYGNVKPGKETLSQLAVDRLTCTRLCPVEHGRVVPQSGGPSTPFRKRSALKSCYQHHCEVFSCCLHEACQVNVVEILWWAYSLSLLHLVIVKGGREWLTCCWPDHFLSAVLASGVLL